MSETSSLKSNTMNRKLAALALLLIGQFARGQTFPIHIEAESHSTQSGTANVPCDEGGTALGHMQDLDWAEYQIFVARDSVYKLSLRLAGTGGDILITDSVFNVVGKISFQRTKSLQTYATVSTFLAMQPGNRRYRVLLQKGRVNINWLEVQRTGLLAFNDFESDHEMYAGGLLPWKFSRADSTLGMPHAGGRGWIKQTARPGSLVLDNTRARTGRSSGRFELTKADSAIAPNVRSELYQPAWNHQEYWIGFSFMSPTVVTGDGNRHIWLQAHGTDDAGETARSPCFALEVENDSFKCKILWASLAIQTNGNNDKDGEKVFNLGKYEANTWIDWVIHVKFAYNNTGIIEIWRDGNLVASWINQPNGYNDQIPPYWKFGIYKWPWKGGGIINGTWQWWSTLSPYSTLVHYYDNLKIGGASSNRAEVDPANYN
jgi:hypothetical protein